MASSDSIPETIIIEILLRLPVKSLCRFICVCKSWYNLIKSNTFILQHFHHNNTNNKEYLLVQHCDNVNKRCVFNLLSDDLVKCVNGDFYHRVPPNTLVSGPCNGIFCLYHAGYEVAILWNPANREIRVLPTLRYYDVPQSVESNRECLQLGWDQRMNDYKVVLFEHRWDERYDYINTSHRSINDQHVAVYSLNNDSWTHFEDNVPFYSVYSEGYTCLRGVFYWCGLGQEAGTLHGTLLSFHLSDEVFEEIAGPSFLLGARFWDTHLAIYNDHIALIHSGSNNIEKSFDIWALVEGYWKKMFTIGPIEGVQRPLGFWKHGEVFFETNTQQLILYESQSRQVKDLGVDGGSLQVLRYKESLVSVKRVGGYQPENFLDAIESDYRPQDFSDVVPVADFFSLIPDF